MAQLLHYRAWQGAFRSPAWAIWPVARWRWFRLARWRLFWTLYAAGLLLFLMFFFGAYLLDWAETQIPTEAIQFGKVKVEPDRLVKALRQTNRVLNGSQDTFGYFFVYQGLMVMIVLALTGSVMVGDDYTYGSVPFYLAKPINRWHFLVGKMLAVGIVVNLLTTLPALGSSPSTASTTSITSSTPIIFWKPTAERSGELAAARGRPRLWPAFGHFSEHCAGCRGVVDAAARCR